MGARGASPAVAYQQQQQQPGKNSDPNAQSNGSGHVQMVATTNSPQKTKGYQERGRTGAEPQRFAVGRTSSAGCHAGGIGSGASMPGYHSLTNRKVTRECKQHT
jgi:hypothetical protein